MCKDGVYEINPEEIAMPAPLLPQRWDTQVAAFLRAKRAGRMSTSTLTQYASHLTAPRIADWLQRSGVDEVGDLTPALLRDLHLSLAEGNPERGWKACKPNTVHSHHRVFKTFARWCEDEGYTQGSTILKVKAPRTSIVKPETFSDRDIDKLLRAARNPRDHFLMEFLLGTGLRLSEAMGVCLSNIHEGPDGSWIHVVQGKGAKDRVVPMDTPKNKLSKKLRLYVRTVRPQADCDELFLSNVKPRGGDYVPLTADAVKQMLSRLGDEAGVPHVHAHRFRHTFATRAIASGVNVLALQRAMGHTTLAMTQRYTQFDASSLMAEWSHRRD